MYCRSQTRDVPVPVFETMEPRLLLDGNPVITEFLAENSGGFEDQFGRSPDWIEIYNPTTDAVNLLGWHLTDDLADLDQWTFPDVTILPGEYMVVFASGDNLRDPSQPLHTNFGLSKNGDSLALVKPNAQTIDIVSSYTFGPQEENVSYGIYPTTTVTPLVSAGVLARTLVPTGDIGTTWTQYGYSDVGWIQGSDKKTGVGFEVNVPGFAVTRYKATVSVTSLTQAETVIATPSQQSGSYALNDPLINYMDTSGGGHYGADLPFPGYTIGLGLDNYVVRATGKIYIPTAGAWTFGVSSNDGFGLSLTNGVDTFSLSYPGVRAAGDTLGVFNVATPGWYDARLVYFENTGGAELEFFAAPGTHATWDTDFRLVGDTGGGGLDVRSDPVTSGAGSTSFLPLISTNVGSTMMNQNSSVYVRVPFTVTNPAAFSSLTLRMRYDDGFVVYLNGV
ncbi:MAG: lamin tail domain-containing protein, partial [Planctomycetes bacterium]|nr:lamin tail domain-containing protein [Planctomycetota bacterium]